MNTSYLVLRDIVLEQLNYDLPLQGRPLAIRIGSITHRRWVTIVGNRFRTRIRPNGASYSFIDGVPFSHPYKSFSYPQNTRSFGDLNES